MLFVREQSFLLTKGSSFVIIVLAMKRTWQPKKKKRLRKHGFLKLMSTKDGRNTIKRRRTKGRKILARFYKGKQARNIK